MGILLRFPEKKSIQATELRSSEAKKAFLSLSLMSLIVMAVMVSENWSQKTRPIYIVAGDASQIENVNRTIASAQPQNLFLNVEREHELAQKLAQVNERSPAALIGQKDPMDQFRYAILQGKYRIQHADELNSPLLVADQDSHKISEIEYVNHDEAGDRPITFSRDQFLKQYKDLFSVRYADSKLVSTQGNREVHQLIDATGKNVGNAAFELDEEGNILTIKFEQTSL